MEYGQTVLRVQCYELLTGQHPLTPAHVDKSWGRRVMTNGGRGQG
jgi:hypothetical protein